MIRSQALLFTLAACEADLPVAAVALYALGAELLDPDITTLRAATKVVSLMRFRSVARRQM